jgi:hypothetical protein
MMLETTGRSTLLTRIRRLVLAPACRTVLRLLFSASLLAFLLSRMDLGDFQAILDGGALRPILAALAILMILPLVQAQRWRLIAASLDAPLGFGAAAKNVYIGQLFNQILPSSIGGDAVRVWKLAPAMPIQLALSSVALDRIVALLTVPIILTIGCGMLLNIVPPGPFRWSLVGMIVLIACGFMALLLADHMPLPRTLARLRIVEVVRAMPAAARRLLLDPVRLVLAVALSIFIHVAVGTSMWLVAGAFGPPPPLAVFLVLAPLIILVTAIPISIGGWGVREGAMITALGLVHMPSSAALTTSIAFGLIMMLVGVPGALLMLFGPAASKPPRQFEAEGFARIAEGAAVETR